MLHQPILDKSLDKNSPEQAQSETSSSLYANDWQKAQQVLEFLTNLNYRTGQLSSYLNQIANGVSCLLNLDWSVVTICYDGQEQVMASSLPVVCENDVYALHGTLTETVTKTGSVLAVEDAVSHPEYGRPPEGYVSYLGIPMITSTGKVLGTICSFASHPRQFSSAEVHTVELFADRAASAIENYQLFQQLQHLNENLEAEVVQRTEELRSAQARLIEQERLAAIGEFSAMIVHEIRNPVTTILMALKAIQPDLQGERNKLRVELALDETDRLQDLVKEILLYSKPQVLEAMPLELNSMIETLLAELCELPAAVDRELTFMPADQPLPILGDRNKLKQIMINLVRNAFEAIAPGEAVTCRLGLGEQGQACLQIHNGGEPISPEVLPRLTQPFCSTKVGGTGLGLAVVKRIVDAHSGGFSIESTQADGTTVTLTFPVKHEPTHTCIRIEA